MTMHEMTRLLSHLVEMELVMEIIFLDCREVLAIYDTYGGKCLECLRARTHASRRRTSDN